MIDLNEIKDPSFLKSLSKKEMKELASQIREHIISNVSQNGGHLSSNLGVVELTIALHYCFNDETDKLIFDVGHQTYTHKILTGRASQFDNLRRFNGLSGYASYEESIYDVWESGHSSTSLSAMAGFLKAKENGEDIGNVVAIIGDSSIASGMAFEALNYIGENRKSNPIIILNDNEMSISKSVGALNKALSVMRSNKLFRKIKSGFGYIIPNFIKNFFYKAYRMLKSFIQHDNIFETLGYDYFGPINGNDIGQVIRTIKRAKKVNSPCVIHVITEKGKGYKLAEEDEIGIFHNISPFDRQNGKEKVAKRLNEYTYSEIICEGLFNIRKNHRFTVINPAMILGTKMLKFTKEYKSDLLDVGIAEEHAATMAAAIAKNNQDVVLLMYSTFLQRAYDQILNDIARQNLKVIIGIDRAGIVGEDGSTHQGIYDIAMIGHMPNFKICMPKNGDEAIKLLNYAFSQKSPIAIRYPRGKDVINLSKIGDEIIDEKWEIIHHGQNGIVISYGPDLDRILKIVENNNLDVTIINARFIRPLDQEMILRIVSMDLPILLYEQVVRSGSLFNMISTYLYKNNLKVNSITSMAIDDDEIVTFGSIREVLDAYHLGDKDILEGIKKMYEN